MTTTHRTTHHLGGLRYFSTELNPNHHEPALIWIGGSLQPVESMSRFNAEYARYRRFIGIDLPGMADADYCPSDLGPDYLADCIEQVVREYRLHRVDVACASYGGFTALGYCARYPHRVQRLLATATMPEVPPEVRAGYEAYIEAARQGDAETMARLFAGQLFNEERMAQIPKAAALNRAFQRTVRRISRDDMDKVAANTQRLLNFSVDLPDRLPIRGLFLTGEFDPITPPSAMESLTTKFEDGQVTCIENADHMFHLEQPLVFFELMRAFLADEPLDSIPGHAPMPPRRSLAG